MHAIIYFLPYIGHGFEAVAHSNAFLSFPSFPNLAFFILRCISRITYYFNFIDCAIIQRRIFSFCMEHCVCSLFVFGFKAVLYAIILFVQLIFYLTDRIMKVFYLLWRMEMQMELHCYIHGLFVHGI